LQAFKSKNKIGFRNFIYLVSSSYKIIADPFSPIITPNAVRLPLFIYYHLFIFEKKKERNRKKIELKKNTLEVME